LQVSLHITSLLLNLCHSWATSADSVKSLPGPVTRGKQRPSRAYPWRHSMSSCSHWTKSGQYSI